MALGDKTDYKQGEKEMGSLSLSLSNDFIYNPNMYAGYGDEISILNRISFLF
jgi:hypothetical protein